MPGKNEKTVGLSPDRHRKLKIIAANADIGISEALERFGGPAIDAEYERQIAGAVAPPEAPGKRVPAGKREG